VVYQEKLGVSSLKKSQASGCKCQRQLQALGSFLTQCKYMLNNIIDACLRPFYMQQFLSVAVEHQKEIVIKNHVQLHEL
jgi:hypothetical protein